MNFDNIIVALIGGLFGAGITGLIGLLKVRSDNRRTEAEAGKLHAEAEQSRANASDTAANAWIKLTRELTGRIEILDRRVCDLEAALQAKDALVDEQERKLAEQGRRISELEQAVEARDAQIAALEEKIQLLETR